MNRFSSRTRGIVLGLLLAAIPVSVFASDLFTDVPNTLNSHDAIGNIAQAGITLGDPVNSNTYQPNKNVNRGQMASFMNRGLGRVAYSGNGANVALTATPASLGTATLVAGGAASDGTPIAEQANFFKADASFSVTCAAACQVTVVLTDGTDSSRTVTVALGEAGTEHGSITWANDFAPASTVDLDLNATEVSGTATAAGEVTAMYSPFGAAGTNTLDAP